MEEPVRAPSIQASIRQQRPFPSVQAEALIALLRTADRASDVVRRALEPVRLSMPQYNVLRVLRGAGRAGLRTYEVAERLISRSPNITRLVDKLEARGLLTRSRSARDRRSIRLRITAEGRRLLVRLEPRLGAAGRAAMRGLPENDLNTLVALLDRLRQPLEERPEQEQEKQSGTQRTT